MCVIFLLSRLTDTNISRTRQRIFTMLCQSHSAVPFRFLSIIAGAGVFNDATHVRQQNDFSWNFYEVLDDEEHFDSRE